LHESIFDRIYSWATFTAAIFAANLVALFKAWPLVMSRLNERHRDVAAEKAGDWERIRAERDAARKDRDLMRERWALCEVEKNDWMRRAITAEATLQGFGEWKQMLAVREAARRLATSNEDESS